MPRNAMPIVEVCALCHAPRPCHCTRTGFSFPKSEKRWRSEEFLAFVRTLPCSVPNCNRQSEPHHAGPRGLGEKVHDCLSIPLCRGHHEEAHNRGTSWEWYPEIKSWQVATMVAAIIVGAVTRD